jgi:hypothetical protein
MTDEIKIVTVDKPVIEDYTLQFPLSNIIYSVTLPNGVIATSPEGFETVCQTVSHKPIPPAQKRAV